jgi:hypothetical protein
MVASPDSTCARRLLDHPALLTPNAYGCGVKPSRSMPFATVIPILACPDVSEAVDRLSRPGSARGAAADRRTPPVRLRLGDGAVIVADGPREQRPPRGA